MIRNNPRKISLGIALTTILFVTLACGASANPIPPSPTSEIPTVAVQPTQTTAPLYLSVTLTSVPHDETGDNPIYTAKAQIPNLQGSDDERVVKFNNEMAGLTQEEIGRFKDNARMVIVTSGSGSGYDQKFTLLSAPGNILSIKFDINTYISGAAHPNTHTRVVNYDLEGGQDLNLDQLFLPGADYLKTISTYCIADLKSRPIDFTVNSAGAEPNSQNYGNWNITPDGLLITFDEYQVAAYALGAQLVTVPYSELKSIIDPNGPIGQYAQ